MDANEWFHVELLMKTLISHVHVLPDVRLPKPVLSHRLIVTIFNIVCVIKPPTGTATATMSAPFVFDAVTLIIVMVITISGHYISRCSDLHYPNQFASLSI